MTAEKQIDLVNEIGARILSEIADKINAGKIPAEWDGVELRHYLKIKFDEAAFMQLEDPKGFHNDILINNL